MFFKFLKKLFKRETHKTKITKVDRKEIEKWQTILRNIEIYDGTSKGQKKIG